MHITLKRQLQIWPLLNAEHCFVLVTDSPLVRDGTPKFAKFPENWCERF